MYEMHKLEEWIPCADSQAGQWVSLGGSSTVRSTGGGKNRNQEQVSLFAL